jgi:hypothetical protein
VSVDGSCTRVAYVSDRGSTRQVYLWERGVRRPRLLSRTPGGRPGNGSSYDVSISRGGRDGKPGSAVVFASQTTNLDRRDRSPTADVYLVRLRDRRPAPRLVSTTSRGRPGNGPSTQPDVALEGAYVAFTTEASDLLPGDTNGVADIARASTRAPGSFVWASKSETIGAIADGPSSSPTTVEPGSVVAFESDATNLQASATSSTSDRNRSRDIFYFAALSRNVSLQSRDSDNGILNNFAHSYATTDPRYTGHQAHAPAQNPQLSYYGNYLLFDSSYPLVDLRVGRARFGYTITGWEAAQLSLTDPALRQIYLRYIGPR